MKILQCEQRSPEWFQAKLAVPSASRFSEIVTTKGIPSEQRKAYMYQLACEAVSGIREDRYKSAAMEMGILRENEARKIYAMEREVEVEQVGFCLADSEHYGCSPDALVGSEGSIEIKCPTGKTAVEYLMQNKLPSAYFQQVQGQLLVTRRSWDDFVSYYPGLPLFIIRVTPDLDFQKRLEKELEIFHEELESTIKWLISKE